MPLYADAGIPGALVQPTINSRYNGGFLSDFPEELSLVKILIPPAQLDMSTQLGLSSYNQGFRHPVTIRFDDGGPALSENKLFYVQPPPLTGSFEQTLMVNVEAFSKISGDSNSKGDAAHRALNYAMTQLILNDIAGVDADKALPEWVQEGTAVYLSGMGPSFVEKVGTDVTRSHVDDLMDDLNRPLRIVNKRQYARYNLAIRYIVSTGGSGAFQAFMGDLLKDPSAAAAIQDSMGQDWPTFEEHVRVFSKAEFMTYARADENTGTVSRPKSYP